MTTFTSKEELYDFFDKMVAALNKDETFVKLIAREDVSLGFTVPELGADYALTFREGKVIGLVGSAGDSAVGVACNADTLEKLLSGALNGETAYMTGAIRLRGSEWTAQSVAGYQYYLTSAYKAVVG